jgi:hypothetical protein
MVSGIIKPLQGVIIEWLVTSVEYSAYWNHLGTGLTQKTHNKGSRFPDGQHVFNASHFDILVTRDKGMKNRTEAVYKVLGIDTVVMLYK